MKSPLHPAALTGEDLRTETYVTILEYINGNPISDGMSAILGTLLITEIDLTEHTFVALDGLHERVNKQFEDCGIPDTRSDWSAQYCTLPRDIAIEVLRGYVDSTREPLNRGYMERNAPQLIDPTGGPLTPNWAISPELPQHP